MYACMLTISHQTCVEAVNRGCRLAWNACLLMSPQKQRFSLINQQKYYFVCEGREREREGDRVHRNAIGRADSDQYSHSFVVSSIAMPYLSEQIQGHEKCPVITSARALRIHFIIYAPFVPVPILETNKDLQNSNKYRAVQRPSSSWNILSSQCQVGRLKLIPQSPTIQR